MKKGTGWKKLTRSDLTTFDNDATEAVLLAMARGGIGRITTQGHAFIRAPEGRGSMSVSRDTSAPNCKKNVEVRLNKLFPPPDKVETKEVQMQTTPAFVAPPAIDALKGALKLKAPNIKLPTATSSNGSSPDDDLIPCPAEGCGKEFATEGALYRHMNDDHVVCTWEGCNAGPQGGPYIGKGDTLTKMKQSIAGHTNIAHRGNKPWDFRHPAPVKPAETTVSARNGTTTRATSKVSQKAGEFTSGLPSATPKPSPVVRKPVTPKATPEPAAAKSPAAILAAIRELLGPDPRVAELESEVADLHAKLDLISEALHIDAPKK